jgi:acylphosphatase
MSEEPASVCRRVTYRGRVQGVGFRWTTARIARPLGVVGWVRNCNDGSVELVAQGTAEQVSALLDELSRAMAGYIESADVTEESVQADLSGFSIRS